MKHSPPHAPFYARPGCVWACTHCMSTSVDRYALRPGCAVNAVEVVDRSMVVRDGRVLRAELAV